MFNSDRVEEIERAFLRPPIENFFSHLRVDNWAFEISLYVQHDCEGRVEVGTNENAREMSKELDHIIKNNNP